MAKLPFYPDRLDVTWSNLRIAAKGWDAAPMHIVWLETNEPYCGVRVTGFWDSDGFSVQESVEELRKFVDHCNSLDMFCARCVRSFLRREQAS